MSKVDVDELKERVKLQTATAKQKTKQRKKLKEQPNPQFVDMDSIEYTENPELDSELELDAVAKGFRERAKNETNRFALATDSEYWACICFQTREQKDAFLKALNLFNLGDKYLDGQEVAEVLGIELPEADVPYNTSSKVDKAWLEFVD